MALFGTANVQAYLTNTKLAYEQQNKRKREAECVGRTARFQHQHDYAGSWKTEVEKLVRECVVLLK